MPTQQQIYEAGLVGLIVGLANTANDRETMVCVDTQIRFAWATDGVAIQSRVFASQEGVTERIQHLSRSQVETLYQAASALRFRVLARDFQHAREAEARIDAIAAETLQEPVEPPIQEPEPEPEPPSVWDRLDKD